MEIYVIRHTQISNPDQICYGQSDMPLASTFNADVKEMKAKLSNINFDAIYCSPSKRCNDLAQALEYKNIQTELALQEMNFGNWEGQKWSNINQQELDIWMANFVEVKTPNGENLNLMYKRVKTCLENIYKLNHKKILLITHAGVIRCLWAIILEMPLKNIFKIPVDYQEVFSFSQHPDYGLNVISKK